jgi:tRNA threonylcarbamoyladenosine biosynthesis protein TsaE
VLSRVHRSQTGKPDLVHVDAYRLSSAAELDDLDLDAHTADAITLVEWGSGVAEGLAEDRLEIDIRPAPNGDHDGRLVLIRGVGRRWHHVDLEGLHA